MVRKIAWTNPAWDDLEAAANYIERDSKFYAMALLQEAHDAADSPADFADRGQAVPEFGDEFIRELLVKPYRCFYSGAQRLWRL